MNDLPPTDANASFVGSLVRAARNDAPPLGAKARAFAGVAAGGAGAFATAAAAARAAARGSRTVSPAALGLGGALAIAAAAAAVLVARGHGASPAAPRVTVTEPSAASAHAVVATPPRATRPSAARAPEAPAAGERVLLEDREPTVCSQPGRSEVMEVVNTYDETVDLFWVDFKCRETFTARLAPGESLRHHTYDTHPWRVRDHATHRLLKEWVGPAQPEPRAEPVAHPDVVISEGASAKDAPPLSCSKPSDKASVRFVNQRSRGVSIVFWVDFECHEQVYRRLEPGETWAQSTYSAHPWRVRDESGALLVDFVPDAPDETVYVSVP